MVEDVRRALSHLTDGEHSTWLTLMGKVVVSLKMVVDPEADGYV